MMDEDRWISDQWFYKQYAIYGGTFLLLCAAAAYACFTDFHIKIVIPAALAVIALLLIFFVGRIKKGVLEIFRECDQLLDQAMDGQIPDPPDEDTELALFQTKLCRFVIIKDKASKTAKQQKGQVETLLADISHQTKTPIANILLYSQLLEEKPQARPEILVRLMEQTKKLKFLIETLVDMARLENGIIRCVISKQKIKPLLVQVIGDVYQEAEEKAMEMKLDCEAGTEAVFDFKWAREAIGNLAHNAVKYSPVGSTVSLRVIPYEMYVEIQVIDAGMGISEQELPKIFGRFYRSRDVAREEGLGLGLYLARNMVAAQKGYIKVFSEKGKGSRFSVFLPAEKRWP
ncbi:MAG: HAMP domain-containing histidine kinase [Firmicutes bacterium]|nr:HAMP domain-containing histidine kinase [Bacillota bacterium]